MQFFILGNGGLQLTVGFILGLQPLGCQLNGSTFPGLRGTRTGVRLVAQIINGFHLVLHCSLGFVLRYFCCILAHYTDTFSASLLPIFAGGARSVCRHPLCLLGEPEFLFYLGDRLLQPCSLVICLLLQLCLRQGGGVIGDVGGCKALADLSQASVEEAGDGYGGGYVAEDRLFAWTRSEKRSLQANV
eukprot:3253269-Prymnesium_polylepis.2